RPAVRRPGPPARRPTPSRRPLGDRDDLVGDVARGNLDRDVLALLLAEQRAPDRALVADPAFGRLGLGRADDGERLRAVGAADLDRRADLDVVVGVVLVDERGVLDQRLDHLDAALDERLLVLGVLVLGILREVAVLLGVMDPLGDLWPPNGDHRLELQPELAEAFFADVGGLVVHSCLAPGNKERTPAPRSSCGGLESRVGGVGYRAPRGVSKAGASAARKGRSAGRGGAAASSCPLLPRTRC